MAKTSKGGGPGTNVRGGVSTTMTPAFPGKGLDSGVGGGKMDANYAPFDKSHSTGTGGIKEKFFDGMGGKANPPKTGAQGGE